MARGRISWLSERTRSATSAAAATMLGAALVIAAASVSITDGCVLVLLGYLSCYLAVTTVTFSTATPERIRAWAEREDRGTFLQRYVYGTAPGPGVSLFVAGGALAVAVFWLPVDEGSAFPQGVRVAITFALVAVAWACAAISFAVAFHADDLVGDQHALDFPEQPDPGWSDYVYFAVAVMSTFGTTDVTVTSAAMRRTVTVNAIVAFVFNTVIVATLVSALSAL